MAKPAARHAAVGCFDPPFAVERAVTEHARKNTAVGPGQAPLARHGAILEVSFVLGAAVPFQCSDAVQATVYQGAPVTTPVRRGHFRRLRHAAGQHQRQTCEATACAEDETAAVEDAFHRLGRTGLRRRS